MSWMSAETLADFAWGVEQGLFVISWAGSAGKLPEIPTGPAQ